MMMTLRGVTPVIEMAIDHERERVYYGRSDRYIIHVVDLAGDEKLVFGIERERGRLTLEAKQAHFENTRIPPEQVQAVVESLPTELTCFRRIQVVGDLVLVTATTGISRRPTEVLIDIFSLAGEYLYRASLEFAGSESIFGNPDNLIVHGESFYVSLEDAGGQKSVARYRIQLPD